MKTISKTTYKTKGTCAVSIDLEIVDGKIGEVSFERGCPGNLQAVSKLVQGMDAEDAMTKLRGIDCRGRGTSCADQLSKAIEQALHGEASE